MLTITDWKKNPRKNMMVIDRHKRGRETKKKMFVKTKSDPLIVISNKANDIDMPVNQAF